MTPESIVSIITGTSGAITVLVVFVALIIGDKLHTDGEFKRILEALNTEKHAHDETRKALAEASARGDAAVRASELIADALSSHRPARRREVRGEAE